MNDVNVKIYSVGQLRRFVESVEAGDNASLEEALTNILVALKPFSNAKRKPVWLVAETTEWFKIISNHRALAPVLNLTPNRKKMLTQPWAEKMLKHLTLDTWVPGTNVSPLHTGRIRKVSFPQDSVSSVMRTWNDKYPVYFVDGGNKGCHMPAAHEAHKHLDAVQVVGHDKTSDPFGLKTSDTEEDIPLLSLPIFETPDLQKLLEDAEYEGDHTDTDKHYPHGTDLDDNEDTAGDELSDLLKEGTGYETLEKHTDTGLLETVNSSTNDNTVGEISEVDINHPASHTQVEPKPYTGWELFKFIISWGYWVPSRFR